MKQYTLQFKEEIVRKKLLGTPVRAICEETGVSDVSIYKWEHDLQNRENKTDGNRSPKRLNQEKKYNLLLEYQSLSVREQGAWLRKNGVHSDHIEVWKKDLNPNMNKEDKLKEENKKLKASLKKAEQKIRRNEKALAEAAALLVLKKKYQHLWEEEEK